MRYMLLIPEIRELLAEGNHQDLVSVLQEMHPTDAAGVLSALSVGEIAQIFALLPPEFERDVFGYLEPDVQEEYVAGAGRERVQQTLLAMLSDDRAEFLERFDPRVRDQLITMLPTAAREDLKRRGTFRDDQVGAFLSTDYAVLHPNLTARAAITELRRQAPSRETIYYSYVLDRVGKLVGFVSLRDLILADQEEAARVIRDYDLIALPVVDGAGRLVGIVTHDDAVDIVEEEAQEDFEKMAGISGHGVEVGDYDYLEEPVLRQVRRRAPVICLLALFWVVTSTVIHGFEGALNKGLLLALLPMVMATGGMVGTQASALIIRALTVGDFGAGKLATVVWKELRVAGLMAAMLGLIAFIDSLLVSRTSNVPDPIEHVMLVGGVIGVAMFGHVVTAALLGALTPLAVKKLRGDPAMISTPAVTAIADLTGAAIYLVLVTTLL